MTEIKGAKPKRGYESWEGKNTILCEGKIIGGPQYHKLLRTFGLVTAPTIIFISSPAQTYLNDYDSYWPLLLGLSLYIASMLSLFVTAFMDPGIIPRPSQRIDFWSRNRKRPPKKQDISMNGQKVTLKFCATCQIFRPPRAFHCHICDNCVERFDHHCPWIGNCIAKRNYGWFSAFLWSTLGLCCFVMGMCIRILVLDARDQDSGSKWDKFSTAIKNNWLAVVLVIYVFCSIWFVVGLTVFHIYLVCLNKTTNEKLKKMFPFGSPYNLGIFHNIQQLCCTIPFSNVHIHHLRHETRKNEEMVRKKKLKYVKFPLAAPHSPVQEEDIVPKLSKSPLIATTSGGVSRDAYDPCQDIEL